ncbi:HEPN domain-containing protein [Candidatus Woesearchaeota archaeon]|nr:HEPN domain-containing protein [Candidatus Woesearchaeota archaeon]
MSQASEHVEWCLNKAQKEIEDCKNLDKRLKHRGLLKVGLRIVDAKKHLVKAEHNLEGIDKFSEIGFSDWSASAGFYCVYHCFLAIAAKFGYESSNQTCTISLIRFLKEQNKIDIDEKFIELLEYSDVEDETLHVITLREEYTYGTQTSLKDGPKMNRLKNLCKNIIDITKEIVHK